MFCAMWQEGVRSKAGFLRTNFEGAVLLLPGDMRVTGMSCL